MAPSSPPFAGCGCSGAPRTQHYWCGYRRHPSEFPLLGPRHAHWPPGPPAIASLRLAHVLHVTPAPYQTLQPLLPGGLPREQALQTLSASRHRGASTAHPGQGGHAGARKSSLRPFNHTMLWTPCDWFPGLWGRPARRSPRIADVKLDGNLPAPRYLLGLHRAASLWATVWRGHRDPCAHMPPPLCLSPPLAMYCLLGHSSALHGREGPGLRLPVSSLSPGEHAEMD